MTGRGELTAVDTTDDERLRPSASSSRGAGSSAGYGVDSAGTSEAGTPEAPLGTALQRAVGLLAVLVVAGVLVAPRLPVFRYDTAVAALGLLGVVAAWAGLAWLAPRRWLTRTLVRDRWWDVAAAALCVLIAGIAGLIGYGGAYETTWDPWIVAATSEQPPGAYHRYFTLYPNVAPFLAVARTVRSWIAGTGIDYEAAFAGLNTVSLLVTAVAVYLLVRRAAGAARGVLALAALGLLLGTSQWMSVPYTDMATLWSPVVAVALLVAAWRRAGYVGSAVLAAGGGAALAVGYVVKVTPVVGLVALVLTVAVAATGSGAPGRLRLLMIGTCAVAAFLSVVSALGLWVRAADGLPPLPEDRAAAPLVYVAGGLRTQPSVQGGPLLYGAWDRDVLGQTQGKDRATQNAIARRFIREELERRGGLGTVRFAVDKTLFNWGDGTFWARGEGRDGSAPALRRGAVADAVHAWTTPGGRLFRVHVLLVQVTWMAVLLAVGVGLLRSRYRPDLLLMALTVAGIAAFTLLFQGRSRYLLVHVPVVVALAACVVPRDGLHLRRPQPRLARSPARRAARPAARRRLKSRHSQAA